MNSWGWEDTDNIYIFIYIYEKSTPFYYRLKVRAGWKSENTGLWTQGWNQLVTLLQDLP